jgi:LPS-assembly protein
MVARALFCIAFAAWFCLIGASAHAQQSTITADRVEIRPEGVLIAEGSVEVFMDATRLTASRIAYDQRTGALSMQGPIIIRDQRNDVLFLADSAELDQGLSDGIMRAARMVMQDRLQLAANEIRRVDGRYTQLRKTVASSCQVCGTKAPLWQIRADEVVHDQELNRLFFTNARIDFGGLPVVYLPRLSLPAPGTTRATGFLVPEIEPSSLVGTRITIPYFIAIGPHTDVTLTPVIARDSNSLGVRFRRAFRRGLLELNGAVTANTAPGGGLRGYLFSDAEFDLPAQLNLQIHTEWASDNAYPLEYEISETEELTSFARLQRTDALQDFSFSFVQVDSLRDTEDPYRDRLPATLIELEYRRILSDQFLGGTLMFKADGNARYRSSTTDVLGRDIARLGAELDWRRTDILGAGLVWSNGASVRSDAYAITDDTSYSSFPINWQNEVFTELRFPLIRQRPNGRTEIVEPVLNVSWKDRRGGAVPNGDARVNELDFGNLYAVDHFSGSDRSETGLRVAAGVHWSSEGQNGLNWRLAAGRIWRADAATDFTKSDGLGTILSDWLLGAQVDFGDRLGADTTLLLAPDGSLTRASSTLRYARPRFSLTARHSWVLDDPGQNRVDPVHYLALGSEYQFSRNWSGGFEYGYDIATERADLAAMHFGFENECLAADLSLSHRLTSSGSVLENLDFGLEVSLLGFGGTRQAVQSSCVDNGSFLQ